MKYVIFGIPGVGKTTVINGVIERTNIKVVNMGDLMTELALELNLIKTRDDLRKLDYKMQQELRERVIDKMIMLHDIHGDLLIDIHAVVKTPQGYMPGFDKEMLKRLNPDMYIVLYSKPEDIISRRKTDKSRSRDEDSIETIAEGLEITKMMAITYSVLSMSTYNLVENRQGNIHFASEKISNLIKKVP